MYFFILCSLFLNLACFNKDVVDTNYPWDDDYLNESIEASNQMFESLNDMKFE